MKVTIELDFSRVVRWLLAAVLLLASVSKLANPQEFYASLVAYQLPLALSVVRLVAIVLPWLELLCGVLLLVRGARHAALAWTVVLFASFVLATGQAWVRGLNISCGCFHLDFLANPGLVKLIESIPFAFFRAALLLVGALYLFRQQSRQQSASIEAT